uniref:Uncharacterized protein n=1 Tax=Panagrolaimus davidi TaxID=227884 RepID=A0A914QQ49_9BILA
MYKFIFIVVILLLFLSSFCSTATAAAADSDLRFCNESDPIFSEVTEEIHAMLARDRYIDFIGWNQSTKDYRRGRPQKIPYGYIKEMILHLSSVPGEDGSMNARIIFTSNGTKLFDVELKNVS